MQTRAVTKGVRISPLKARIVANKIRGMHVSKAIDLLEHSPKKAAKHLLKTLLSAMANAENNHGLDVDKLFVKEAFVGKGLVMKRLRARARGRAARVLKPFSHLSIIVHEKEDDKNGSES